MSVKRVIEEHIFQGPVTFEQIPTKYQELFIASETTPDVTNLEILVDSGVATTITDFIGGSIGQTLRILGKGFMTVSDNANIVTNTGANKLLADGLVYRFTYFDDGIWHEDA
jgi:hypothetical protein